VDCGVRRIGRGADAILIPEHHSESRVFVPCSRSTKNMVGFFDRGSREDAHPIRRTFLNEDQSSTIYRHDRLGGIGEALAREIERCSAFKPG